MQKGKVYLVPCFLDESSLQTIPPYVTEAIKDCQAFFVENERSARRYLKKLWKEMVIDDYQWQAIGKGAESGGTIAAFRKALREGKNIAIISEAGCPGIADPGQELVAAAQEEAVEIRPLVGPSSILLALMASGMNGQKFQFLGYLPVDNTERMAAIRALETESKQRNLTQIFIETPYRNNQLVEAVLKYGNPQTRFCIAVDLSGPAESVRTMSIAQWRENKPELHKRPAIFLLHAGKS